MTTLKNRKKQTKLNLTPTAFPMDVTTTPCRLVDTPLPKAHTPPELSPDREADAKRARSDLHTTPNDKDASQIDRGPSTTTNQPIVSPMDEEYVQNPVAQPDTPLSPPKRQAFASTDPTFTDHHYESPLPSAPEPEARLAHNQTNNTPTPSPTSGRTNPYAQPPNQTGNTDNDGFTTVNRQTTPRLGFGKWPTFNKSTLCENNRKYMMFWNYKIVVDPNIVPKGEAINWIMNHLKTDFMTKAKALDETFVLYRYRPQPGETDAIVDVDKFPTSFTDLNGGGKTTRYKNCYFHGLRTWDARDGKSMNIHTEIRVGYEQKDLPLLLQEHVRSLNPQPYLRPKDLQAPDTVEIGFFFMGNPMMRDRTVFERLKKITTKHAIQRKEGGVVFAVSNRFLQDGDYDKKKPKSTNRNPIQSPRALHIEGLASDRSRTKAYIQLALKSADWKRYTNAPISILPTVRDAEEPSRAKMSVEQHRTGMKNLGWTVSTQITNPDHRNEVITFDDGKRATLRDIVMDMEMPVEIHDIHDGKRRIRQTKDKMFQSLDEKFGSPGEWVFVYPKSYEATAINRVKGLYAYIRHMHHNGTGGTLEECETDIECWFTSFAKEESQGLLVEDGKVITTETIEQRQAMANLTDLPWITGMTLLDSPGAQENTTVDRTARKFNPDTASIHTQCTTATKIMSKAMEEAIQQAELANMVDTQNRPPPTAVTLMDVTEGDNT